MSEMLGNQYFLARNFANALIQFEKILTQEPHNNSVQKKLIICYCEVGNVKAGLELFERVIQSNIELIAETDIVGEDCPCPELVDRMKWYEEVASNSFDYHCILGILNLYCNTSDSISYFEKAAQMEPENKQIARILSTIEKYVTNTAAKKD